MFILPSGKYVISDFSIVLGLYDLGKVQSARSDNNCKLVHRGYEVVVFETATSDSCRATSLPFSFRVEEQNISAVPYDLCDEDILYHLNEDGLCLVLETGVDLVCKSENGILSFGSLVIDTNEEEALVFAEPKFLVNGDDVEYNPAY